MRCVVVALVLVALVALAACAPKDDYTPPVTVEAYAAQRICWFCVERRTLDAVTCPADVERVCAVMRSDLKGPPIITYSPDE